MIKTIYLKTKNKFKFNEYKEKFSLYSINVIQINKEQFNKLKNKLKDDEIIIFDKNNLYYLNKKKVNYQHLKDKVKVYNQIILTYITNKEKKIIKSPKFYGYIDLNRKKNTFGWDSYFINPNINKSMLELKELGFKNTMRDYVLSNLIKEKLFYKNFINNNFLNINKNKEVLNFDGKIIDFIKNNKYFNLNDIKKSGLLKLFEMSLKNGASIIRKANNRRIKNYWLPGLNAGIPAIPKKDYIHELTFLVHDLSHFAMPDLLIDFESLNEKVNKQIYIIYRMLSEALTMIIADMYFINILNKNNIKYDYSKRKIYPLYQNIETKDLIKILKANAYFALTGNDKYYYELKNNKNFEIAFKSFKEKYSVFFKEDYKWTLNNYENLKNQKKFYSKWIKDLKKYKLLQDKNLHLTSDLKYLYDKNIDKLIENIFNFSLKFFEPVLNKQSYTTNKLKKEELLKESYKNYMIGQSYIFYKYNLVTEIIKYKKDYLKNIKQGNFEDNKKIYEKVLNILLNKFLINKEEYEIYKNVFPIFKPNYVFYDNKNIKLMEYQEIFNQLL